MATYASLSDSDKLKIKQLVDPMRSFAGELARVCNHGRAIASKWSGDVETIVGTLDSNSVVPNTSNETGAVDLTKEQIQNLAGYFITLSDPTDNATGSYNSNYHRALFVKAIGLLNTLG
jgi:hypothetical protein